MFGPLACAMSKCVRVDSPYMTRCRILITYTRVPRVDSLFNIVYCYVCVPYSTFVVDGFYFVLWTCDDRCTRADRAGTGHD